jgi:hypothetical protein
VDVDLHDVVLVSPGLRPRIERPGPSAARSSIPLACGVGGGQEAFGRNPIERPGGDQGGAPPLVGYSREASGRWRSVMLVAEGDGRRDLQGGTLTDFE